MSGFVRTFSLSKRGISNYFTKKPFCVSFEVTFACNARCKHCNRSGPVGSVKENRASPEVYGRISRQIKPLIAQLSGGEPLLRKDLEEIVAALRISNRAPYVIVITNGILLTKEKFYRLREAGVDRFSISLDYPDDRHDDFRSSPGLFKHLENLIKDIHPENDNVITLCCVVQNKNFREFIRIAELAKEWKCNINFSTYTTLRTGDKSYFIPNENLGEFKEIIRQLLRFKKKHRNIFTSNFIFKKMPEFFEKGYIPNCRTGERFLNVNPDGTISPCGLIIKNYKSQKELNRKFSRNNTCSYCYTSIRGNGEKPAWYLLSDSIEVVRN